MEFQKEIDRIYAEDENGELLAEVTFGCLPNGNCLIDHTYVHPKLRNQGIADKLMREACISIREQNKKAVATCSYAVNWFRQNEDEIDVLADE